MGMETSEILFTRQRHEAKRAGLHYDIRLVHGDVAYSWATKKDMPKPGEAIILHQQPIHDSHYALSEKVEIPEGQYGAGVTYLDFVRKANLRQSEDGSYFTLHTKDGEEYLLKHVPNYGEKQWLFKNITGHKKQASVVLSAAMGHLTQNALTNVALRNKRVAQHLADHFATGYAGKSATSIKSKIGGALTHAVAPDVSIAAKGANKLGKQLSRYEPFLDKKDKLALRMVSQGRFTDIEKYKLHDRPMVHRVLGRLGKSHGVDLTSVLKSDKAKDLEKVWKDKKHPLLSNIASNISKGKPIKGSSKKTVHSTGALASSLGLAIAEPGAGALSAVKHLAASPTVRKAPIAGAITHHVEKLMVKNPVKKGWEQGKDYKDGLGNKLFEHVVSPTSAHLQRTAAAVSGVVKKAEIKDMVKAAREKLEAEAKTEAKPVKQDLRPHTLRALKRIEKQDGLLVDHSMGSGKTLLYLKAIERHQQKNPKDHVLVIAPASLTTNVIKEIKKHGVKVDTSRLETLSYEKAAIDADRLKQKVYGMVVADEAHKLRNTGTKRHRELSEVITSAKKRILGTGTTAYNNPSDIAPLVNLAAGKKVLPENKADFEENFIDKVVEQPPLLKRILGHAPKEIHKLKNTKALEKILRKHIDHYDLKDDPKAADKFPTKVESIKRVEMSPEQAGLYKYMEGRLPWHLRYKVRMNMALDRKEMASLNSFSTGVRQVSNSLRSYMPNYHKTTPKIEAAVQSVHEGYKNDKNFKALVYSNYLGSGLEDYSRELTKREIPHAIYHGGLSKTKKDELLDAYNKGEIPILLLSSSGAEGLNTKGTKKVQILEPHFNRSKIDQVVARGVRYQSHQHLPKSERKVEVEHFLTSLPKPRWNIGPKQHSIDEYLHHNSQTKHEIGQQLKELVKESALMVKCAGMLEKEAFFDRPQHDYVRAKYKESTDYSNVKDPVASIKRDGAAFFMEIQPDGSPRFLSRRESVKGGFPDRTANLMYLPSRKVPQFAGNVYHVELFHTGHEYNDEILDSHPAVSGILNSKPERAKATQALTGPVRAMLLDVIKPVMHTYGEKMEHLQEVKAAFGDVPNLHMPAFKIGKDDIDQLIKDTKVQGHEGVIVVSKSEPDANAVRVKVKHVDTYNLRVTGIAQEIDKNGKPKESMGALEVADASGRPVAKVGTGFTRSLREEIWNNPKDWIGRAIQVKAMPTTASRLRAPVYNGIADGDIDTVNERLV
jgi:hypothetical protein